MASLTAARDGLLDARVSLCHIKRIAWVAPDNAQANAAGGGATAALSASLPETHLAACGYENVRLPGPTHNAHLPVCTQHSQCN